MPASERGNRRSRTPRDQNVADATLVKASESSDKRGFTAATYFHPKEGTSFDYWCKDYAKVIHGHPSTQLSEDELRALSINYDRIQLLRGVDRIHLLANHLSPRDGVSDDIIELEAYLFTRLLAVKEVENAVERARELYHERALPAHRVGPVEEMLSGIMSSVLREKSEIRHLALVEVKEGEHIVAPIHFVNPLNADYVKKALQTSKENLSSAEEALTKVMSELVELPVKQSIPLETIMSENKKPEAANENNEAEAETKNEAVVDETSAKTEAKPEAEPKVPFFQTRLGSAVKLLTAAVVGGAVGYGVNRKTGWL